MLIDDKGLPNICIFNTNKFNVNTENNEKFFKGSCEYFCSF